MPNKTAGEIAAHILEDLRGAAYYAHDPKLLAGYLGGRLQNRENAEQVATRILLDLLPRYAKLVRDHGKTEEEQNYLAGQLESHLLR